MKMTSTRPFSNKPSMFTEIQKHESAFSAVGHLITVLRLGGRGARYSVAKALESLFSAYGQLTFWRAALLTLLSGNPSRALVVTNVEMNDVDVLCKILSSSCFMELMGDAAKLCCVLFANTRIRFTVSAARCVEPLVYLLVTEFNPAHQSVVRALEKLVEDEQLTELVAAHGAVVLPVGIMYGKNYLLHEAVFRVLVNLGKERLACKIDMVKAGIIESILDILQEAIY